MDAHRECAVLFAELIGAAELYGGADDTAAQQTIAGCVGRLGQAAESCNARVVKTIGGRLMVLAVDADTAARAAIAMHAAAGDLAAGAASRLALGVGFHCGPVIQRDGDVFGDAVNVAARLVEQAAGGQVLFAAETAGALGATYRRLMRQLYSMPVKGRSEEITLCELVWRTDEPATFLPFSIPKPSSAKLALQYRGESLVLENAAEALTIGREHDCGLVVANAEASRHHCTIQQRNDHFVLADRSTNGTFVTLEGEGEVPLVRDQLVLRRRGWLSFGAPRGRAGEALQFSCD